MDLKSLVSFYVREGLGRSVVSVCDDFLLRRGNEPTMSFWRIFGLAREGLFALNYPYSARGNFLHLFLSPLQAIIHKQSVTSRGFADIERLNTHHSSHCPTAMLTSTILIEMP